ncbi:tRNA preQ1(34) S-adenosylmethionine ribosyltransferase-isomerase QueA [Adlercreutzia mucosicola]|uniref:tRNA preQ1(34) S-adenosylmethionine ribosyltransferase-isomerase QueA n=1 Tax=Adlercreutzia mucosicola TaxID=580026 RepID=UPI002B256131|nr:tRNA preQ1(34) S-adenosylmethionine ribosyltransferase-isomerase QueA [Adlercreutzia mucosicola]MEB1814714.1 tRNA preQ1(34) S-adenosylmethionine ribosyltransferase-isomerase QueA [Adlercreutzia mucosicola]
MRTDDFDYALPDELIAQEPAAERDRCRLLVMDRATGAVEDRVFRDIVDYLRPGDLLVANETRVMPARLLGAKRGTGGAAEVFLLRECAGPEPRTNRVAFWEVLVRPGKRLKPGAGAVVDFTDGAGNVVLSAEIIDWARNGQRGERVARLATPLPSLDEALHAVGHTPLPPYIKDYAGDEELYQTVYSRRESSAAAPTAGLHFTPQLIERLREQGVGWATVELEVGLDTFRIVDEEDPADHVIHTEFYTVPQATVDAVNAAHAAGGRVIAVGTTSVRSLESAWDPAANGGKGALVPRNREATSLYILPGYRFHVVDALITNFHVPRSTLMMLVSAFSTREHVMAAYEHAIAERYRLLSFGDAMFLH